MPRLIYIHGFVEDPTIFDNLAPLLPAESVLKLALQDEFARWNPADDKSVTVASLATYLAQTHHIGPADVVLGHSMGGWIAAHLKAVAGCRAVLVSSYTDPQKVVAVTRNVAVLRFLVGMGLVQSRFFGQYALKKYPFEESRALHRHLIERMLTLPRRYVYQQFRVLLAPSPTPPAPPDVRIHTRSDNVLRCPDEAFCETRGDHFNLVYYPQEVAAPILALLRG